MVSALDFRERQVSDARRIPAAADDFPCHALNANEPVTQDANPTPHLAMLSGYAARGKVDSRLDTTRKEHGCDITSSLERRSRLWMKLHKAKKRKAGSFYDWTGLVCTLIEKKSRR